MGEIRGLCPGPPRPPKERRRDTVAQLAEGEFSFRGSKAPRQQSEIQDAGKDGGASGP